MTNTFITTPGPFKCGLSEEELDALLELPLGDDEEDTSPDDDLAGDSDPLDMPLGDEEPAQEPPAERPQDPQELPAPVEPEPVQEPQMPAQPLPWLEKAQARVRAIGRVRADVEETARAEIEEIAQALEGGGGDEQFAEYAKRLQAGDFADMNAAKRALNFYFTMRFATLTGLYDWAWMYDGAIENHLWACYGDYIPADCWRRYADTLRRDPARTPDPLALFHLMWGMYAKIRAADIDTREQAWEKAAKAAGEAGADVHGKYADRRSKEDFDRAHALREAEDQALTRTAYWWQYSLRAHVKAAGKKAAAGYEKTCKEFETKLGEYL